MPEKLRIEIDALARTRIIEAVNSAGGDRSKAARVLGLTRSALYRWIDRLWGSIKQMDREIEIYQNETGNSPS